MPTNITVLGMGAMGSRMATVLVKAGYRVTVWNRNAEKLAPLLTLGARSAETPYAAVNNADFVLSMVRDDNASNEVWLHPERGALAGLHKGAIAIESSTLSVAWSKTLAERFRTCDAELLEAPVAGTRPQAEAGQLIFFVGGEADVLAQAEPILRIMGGAIHHTGYHGSGSAIKLAVNTLFSVQVAAMAELLNFLDVSEHDSTRALDIISETPVCSLAAKAAGQAIVAKQFAPQFPIELVEKDLNYSLNTAQTYRAWTPIASVTHQIFSQAIQEGYESQNITGIAQLYRESS